MVSLESRGVNRLRGARRWGLSLDPGDPCRPATGGVVIAAPLKIVGGSGSPLRVLAIVAS